MATCDQTGTAAHWVCGASPPASWKAGQMAAIPTRLSSSAASWVTIPILVTARSHPYFSGSAGCARSRLVWQHIRSTSGCTVSRPAPPEGGR